MIDYFLYKTNCGHSWDAINDYIFDVALPRRICFKGWSHIEKNISNDAEIKNNFIKNRSR